MAAKTLPTIKIRHGEDDFSIINAEDFDPETMERWEEPAKPVETATEAAEGPEPLEAPEAPEGHSETPEEAESAGSEDLLAAHFDATTTAALTVARLKAWAEGCHELAYVAAVLDVEQRQEKPRTGAVALLAQRIKELEAQEE